MFVGIYSNEIKHFEQRKDNWCWAASIAIILNYYGYKNITQEEIVEKLHEKDMFGVLPDLPESEGSITELLNKFTFSNAGIKYSLEVLDGTNYIPDYIFFEEFEGKRPLMVSYVNDYEKFGAHIIVIRGANYTVLNDQRIIDSFEILNPGKLENDGCDEFDKEFIEKHINAYWLIRVKRDSSHQNKSEFPTNLKSQLTTVFAKLHRRAFYSSITAKYTTITGLWF